MFNRLPNSSFKHKFIIITIFNKSDNKFKQKFNSFRNLHRKTRYIHPNHYHHYSSVGIALGYGLYDRGSGVRFPAGSGNFSLHYRIQNGSEAHPASYPKGTRGVKLTTHLHLVPRSRMHGAIPPLPNTSSWRGA
jgi:hypothetical protein